MSYRSDVILEITEEERDEIVAIMSKRMGQTINTIGKTDMKKFSKEEWLNLVHAAFNECAPRVMMKRIHVSTPYWNSDTGDDLEDSVPFN